MSSTPAQLPCPFCGKESHRFFNPDRVNWSYKIGCKTPGSDHIKHWQKRKTQ